MKGSIIDDTTAIGKRLNELTSKQVAIVKTAAPPPCRLPLCLRCDDTGWMKDGHNLENMQRLLQSVAKAIRELLERKAQVRESTRAWACVERGAG